MQSLFYQAGLQEINAKILECQETLPCACVLYAFALGNVTLTRLHWDMLSIERISDLKGRGELYANVMKIKKLSSQHLWLHAVGYSFRPTERHCCSSSEFEKEGCGGAPMSVTADESCKLLERVLGTSVRPQQHLQKLQLLATRAPYCTPR